MTIDKPNYNNKDIYKNNEVNKLLKETISHYNKSVNEWIPGWYYGLVVLITYLSIFFVVHCSQAIFVSTSKQK